MYTYTYIYPYIYTKLSSLIPQAPSERLICPFQKKQIKIRGKSKCNATKIP